MQANEQGSNRKPKKTQKNDDKIFPDLIDTPWIQLIQKANEIRVCVNTEYKWTQLNI